MKITSFSTVSAIALTGLMLTLASNLQASDSAGRNASRTVDRLPAGARAVRFNGERCWYGDGLYFRSVSTGMYVTIAKPILEEEGVEPDSAIIRFLPEDSKTVYLGGERCWTHDGVYYRQVGRGFQKFAGGNHIQSVRKARK